MNVLGKIFVIANLIFSVVTAALIIFVYATKTNWHARYQEMDLQAKTAKLNVDAYWELVIKTKAEAKKETDRLAGDLANATDLLKKQTDDNELRKGELAKVSANYEKVVQENKGLVEMNNRFQKESDLVRKQLAGSNAKIVELEKEKGAFRNRAVEAEIAAAGQRDHNERLLEDNERLTRELQKSKAVAASSGQPAKGALTKNPPLEDLEGIVQACDAQSGMVTITLGSNHGIQKNHTLEVFRLAPEGKYLGTIQILDVRADRSVGKPVSRPLAPIQTGDRVASRILGG